VANCCYGEEYESLFTARTAVRTARRFERRGLGGTARQLVDGLTELGVDGASVLEVGGGAGTLHVPLLLNGAARATNVELSPGWEEPARALLAGLGLSERVERRIADFVDEAEGLPEADVVVLHRVLCCYPDWRAMTAATISRARRAVAFTIPSDRWWNRAIIAAENGWHRLRSKQFRAYVHPPEEVIAVFASAGFAVVSDVDRPGWRSVVLSRN
jgi:spermidine synthase